MPSYRWTSPEGVVVTLTDPPPRPASMGSAGAAIVDRSLSHSERSAATNVNLTWSRTPPPPGRIESRLGSYWEEQYLRLNRMLELDPPAEALLHFWLGNLAEEGPNPIDREDYAEKIRFCLDTSNGWAERADALMGSFIWGDSPEGDAYWSEVHDYLAARQELSSDARALLEGYLARWDASQGAPELAPEEPAQPELELVEPPTGRKPTRKLARLKRVNVTARKQKYFAAPGAIAGCDCSVCRRARLDFKGSEHAGDLMRMASADMQAHAKDFAEHGRSFGVEIEYFMPVPRAIAETGLNYQSLSVLRLAEAGVQVRSGSQSGITHWGVKGDESLSAHRPSCKPEWHHIHGVEAASPILRPNDAGFEQIRKVCAALNAAGASVNKGCGLHVHVGARDLTPDQRRNLLTQFIRYEEFFNLILPASRRTNRYAKSPREALSATRKKDNKAAEHAILMLQEITDPRVLDGPHSMEDHHQRLSDARHKHGTYEFRQHSGTLNADKIVNWVRLILQFTEIAKDKPALPFYSRTLTAEEEMEKFFETFEIARDLRIYYRKRHAALYADPENDQ